MRKAIVLLAGLSGIIVVILLLLEGEFPRSRPDRPSAEPPQLVESYPEDGAMAVPRQVQVRLTFDQPMDTASFSGSVKVRYLCSAINVTPAMLPQVRGAYDPEINSLLFAATFIPGEEVEITVADQVRSLAGIALAEPASIQFLVEDDLQQLWKYQQVPEVGGNRLAGRLFFRDREIAGCPGTLATPLGRFRYYQREDGGDTGWNKVDDALPLLKGVPPVLTEEEYVAGYYPGGMFARRQGAPLTWVYLELPGEGRWLNPEKLTGGTVF